MTADFVYPAEEYLLLGKVSKAHGLHGELKLYLYSGQPENFSGYSELFLSDSSGALYGPVEIQKKRVQGKAVIVKLAMFNNRTEAEKVENAAVLLSRKQLPQAGENEYYWHQFQNKLVVDLQGNTIGRVEQLFFNGAQDILVVRSGKKEILIPVTPTIVVGETDEKLIVNPPPGLMELNANSGN